MKGKTWVSLLIWALTALACLGGQGGADLADGVVKVEGVVLDSENRPLGGASVRLGGVEVWTDSEGQWSLKVKPGSYQLEVFLEDFLPGRHDSSDASPCGAGTPCLPDHHLLCFQTVRKQN